MSFTLPEAAKTTVAAIPPAIASVLTVFERQRTRQRGRQRLASISTVVYLSSYAAAGKSSILAGQTITSIPAGAGSTTGIPAPAPFPPAPAETTLGVLTGQIVVGTKSTKAAAGLTSALSLLIVADAGNSGTIWVSTSPNSPAGAKTGTGQEATILSVAEVPAREPNRLGKTDYLVTYQVGLMCLLLQYQLK